MKGELKSGGMALVIASSNPANIGKCVTLKALYKPGDTVRMNGVNFAFFPDENLSAWCCLGDVKPVFHYPASKLYDGFGMFYPHQLMPIDGDPDSEDTKDLFLDKLKENFY